MNPNDLPRPMLTAPDAEASVIVQCIVDPSHIPQLPHITPDHFANALCSSLWATLLRLHEAGQSFDVVSVCNAHREMHGPTDGLMQTLADMLDNTPTKGATLAWANTLHECWQRRRSVQIGRKLAITADAEQAMRDLTDAAAGVTDRWSKSPHDIASALLSAIHDPQPEAYRSGFHQLDELGGLVPGDLTVLLSRPSHGKTAFALNVASNLLADGVPVLVCTGEQSMRAITLRMASSHSRVPLGRIRKQTLTDLERARLADSAEWLRNAPLRVYEMPSPSLADIAAEVRREHYAGGARVIVVDYLQLMAQKGDDMRHSVDLNIKGLKAIARTYGAHVFCLAQARRECDDRAEDGRCPTAADGQHASAIEQDADVLIGMFRARQYDPQYPDDRALFKVLKNRDGETAQFRLNYDGSTVTFGKTTTTQRFAA